MIPVSIPNCDASSFGLHEEYSISPIWSSNVVDVGESIGQGSFPCVYSCVMYEDIQNQQEHGDVKIQHDFFCKKIVTDVLFM